MGLTTVQRYRADVIDAVLELLDGLGMRAFERLNDKESFNTILNVSLNEHGGNGEIVCSTSVFTAWNSL